MTNLEQWVAILALVGALVAALRVAMKRHAEYLRFMQHVTDEEKTVWPAVQSLRQEVTSNHEEVLLLFAKHGERVARIEAKMPNGQLKRVEEKLNAIATHLGLQEES